MNLPNSNTLPIHLLAACFNHKSLSYKFYWFLSILQAVEAGNTIMNKQDLFSGMVSNAWYTVNYFHLSLGIGDQLQVAIEALKESEKLTMDEKRHTIRQRLSSTSNEKSLKTLRHFDKEVPHRFLSPWFPKTKEKQVYAASQRFDNNCLYALYDDYIVINPVWKTYLTRNVRILKDFCYWNLAIYLQGKNPNVPNIPSKLIKAAVRNNLNKQRKNFWDLVLQEVGTVDCIYTGEKLTVNKYAVEHFIPYAFVSHDLMWNLIPADPTFNCSKNDKLPNLDRYFDSFYALQATAIEVIKRVDSENKYLEDYMIILPEVSLIKGNDESSKQRYKEQLQPLITIASNNGFEYMV